MALISNIYRRGRSDSDQPRREVKQYASGGCRVLISWRGDAAKISLRTKHHLDKTSRLLITAELKANALRSRTAPQIGSWGGFSTHICPASAIRTAKAVLLIARKAAVEAISPTADGQTAEDNASQD